jgi:hypothetical protein
MFSIIVRSTLYKHIIPLTYFLSMNGKSFNLKRKYIEYVHHKMLSNYYHLGKVIPPNHRLKLTPSPVQRLAMQPQFKI